jgi:hypothetical protein
VAQAIVTDLNTRVNDFEGPVPKKPKKEKDTMAAPVITDSNQRVDDFEGAVSGTTNRGGGAGVGVEPDIIYQGAQAWSRKVSAAGGAGWWWTDGVTWDLTAAADKNIMVKINLTNKDAINSFGIRYGVGHTTSDVYEWMIKDDGTQGVGEFEYPIKGGWLVFMLDPNVTAWRDFTTGTPDLTIADVFGIAAGLGATAKAENLVWDAIDLSPGLFLHDGTGAGNAGTFSDFVTDDEGTVTAGRFGHVQTSEGIIFLYGTFVIGRNAADDYAGATVFNDTLQTVVFPGGLVDAGTNAIEIELDNASTDIDFSTITFLGRGRDNKKIFFDSELNVTTGTDTIDTVGHGFATGDAVLYDNGGGTNITGLTTGTEYFVERTDADNFQLHTTRQNAFTAATPIAITAATAGNGERHSLRRQPDTRPDLTITGPATKLGNFLSDSCSYISFRTFTLDEGSTIQGGTLVNPFSMVINSGTLDGVVVDSPLLAPGEDFITATTLVNIDNNNFIMGEAGHAIEITATGTFGFVGNTFTGYGNGTASDTGVHDNEFHTQTDVDDVAETITITGDPFVTGEPVFYNDEGGTDTIGLTDGNLYYVRRTAANTFAFYETFEAANTDTNRIGLTDGTTGETHTIYSANAAIVNNSGGSVTIQVSGGGSTPSIRNVGASSTIVENNVALTISGLKDNTEVRVYTAGTSTELAGVENATVGTADDRSVTFSLAAGISVDIRFAHGTAADGRTYLVPPDNAITNFTWPSTTGELPITQVFDRNFNNPA